MTEQIFISYSKKDSEFAHPLAKNLEAAGFKIWIDRSIGGGEQWRDSIEENLKSAGEVIIVVSPNSMASEWVKHEGSLAYGWGKKLYPVKIKPVPSLPPWLEEYQWIDFIDTPYDMAFDALVSALTPPNPIQDLLYQQVNIYRQTGELIGDAILRVITDAQDTLKIDEEAEHLIVTSERAIEARQQKERQVALELENARRLREKIFIGAGIVSVTLLIFTYVVLSVFSPQPTESAPNGVLSLVLAGDLPSFENILYSWDTYDLFLLGFGLGFDFLYMIVYSTALTVGCYWATRKYREMNNWMAKLGNYLIFGMWLAALFDAVENIAVILSFQTDLFPYGPQIASWAAIPKFSIINFGLLYILLAGAMRLFVRKVQ